MPRPVNPCFLHYGDALAVYARNPGEVHATLDRIAAAGYHGVRTWTVLTGDFWHRSGRDVGPWMLQYGDLIVGFQNALKTRGLQWLVSQGDLWQLDAEGRARTQLALQRMLRRDVVAGIDGANEPENNGGARRADILTWLQPFIDAWPGIPWSCGSPISEERNDLNAYAGNVYDVHGYRGGHWWDKIRHIFSLAYEVKPSARLGIQSEPFGPGPFVSVTQNKHELTGDVMAAAAVLSAIARQWWVYFPGFEKGTGDVAQAGFLETPKAMALLPRDLMTFDTLMHGGTSWTGRQWFRVTNNSETCRVDQAAHPDGRRIALAYGPDLQNHEQVRGTVDVRHQFGDTAILYIGQT